MHEVVFIRYLASSFEISAWRLNDPRGGLPLLLELGLEGFKFKSDDQGSHLSSSYLGRLHKPPISNSKQGLFGKPVGESLSQIKGCSHNMTLK